MAPIPDPYEDAVTKWLRKHPKAGSVLAVVVLLAIFGLIGLNEWLQSRSNSAAGDSNVATTIVTVAVVSFVAWRASRKMRNH